MHAQRWGQDSPEIVDFRRVLEINNLHQQITRCEGARDVCALIDARATEFGPANVSNTFRKLTVLETVSSRNSPIAKSSNQAEDREPDTILVIDSDNPPSFVHSGIIFGMNWCINGIKFHILFHTIVMISYQMRWETARHSSVFPKLENGLDRGAPGAKTQHSRIVPWHQGRAKAVYNRDSATDQLETLFGGLGGTPSRRRQTLTSDFKFARIL